MSEFLEVYGIRIPVAASGTPDVSYQERGGEVVPAFAGNLLSSVKGTARTWRVQTPPLPESEARYLEGVLRAPYPVPCDGSLTGGPVLAVVRGLRLRPVARRGEADWIVELELHEAEARAPNGNLLRNPGFEAGGAFWQPGTTRQYLSDPEIARTGSGYLEVTTTDPNTTTPYTADGEPWYVPVRPGDVVTVGAWVQRVSGTGVVGVWSRWYDADRDPLSSSWSSTIDETGPWTLTERAEVVPEGAAYWRGGPHVGISPAVARFDDVYLRIRRAAP